MANIKKTIDIILISAAIAAIVILADRIIPFKNLDASPGTEEKTVMQTSVTSTANVEEAKEYDFKMVINKGLFQPRQDIFAAASPDDVEVAGEEDEKTVTEKDSDGEDLAGGESEAPQETVQVQVESETAVKEEPPVGSAEESGIEKSMDDIDYSIIEDFRIEIDLVRQRLIVFHKDEVLKELVCSGGAPESPTPLGEYSTTQKIEYAWVERFGVGAYYWIRFFEDYLIHSVPFDENGEMIVEEFEKLGNPASHGCIRLRLEEAKWLYETLPLGVKVVIY
jgi:lipoprotein-anchoring transpeptidase ErfK/SrfK